MRTLKGGGMATDTKVVFQAGSSGALSFATTDLTDSAVIPNTFLWTLTELDGTVINSRTDVPETPASTTHILFQGADLTNPGALGTFLDKIVTIKGTYDTLLGGVSKTNVPYVKEFSFKVEAILND